MKSCCMTAGLEPAYDMQWQRQGTALLLRHAASHWDALHTAQQPQIPPTGVTTDPPSMQNLL